MNKRSFAIFACILLMLSCHWAAARDRGPLLRFGAEWGYTLPALVEYRYNYLEETIGYRIDEDGHVWQYATNGFADVFVGYDLSDYIEISLHGGLYGVSGDNRMTGLCLRGSWYGNGVFSDGFFGDLGAGGGMSNSASDILAFFVQAGGGYRVALSEWTALDFRFSLKSTFDHPRIWDKASGAYISDVNVRRNDAAYISLNFSIAVNF